MFPVLLKIGSFTLHTYGFLVALAVFMGIFTAARLSRRTGVDEETMWNLGVYVALAGLLGSKVLMIFMEWDFYSAQPSRIFSMATLQAGGSILGGLIAAFITAAVILYRSGVSFARAGDVSAPGIAVGQAIGRLGCFSAGCCWGKPTDLPWGVTFTDAYSAEVIGVPLHEALHPTQLYESSLSVVIFFVLLWVLRRRQFHGQVFAAYLLLYPVARFCLEFLRDDPRGPFFLAGWLSTPQVVSLAMIAVGMLFWWQQRNDRVAAPAPTS